MNRVLSSFVLVMIGVTPVFVSSVVLASTLRLDAAARADARVGNVGFQTDSEFSHLVGGPVAGPVSDSRTAHAEGVHP